MLGDPLGGPQQPLNDQSIPDFIQQGKVPFCMSLLMPAFKTGVIPLQSQKHKRSVINKLEKTVEKQLHLNVSTNLTLLSSNLSLNC